MSGYGSMSGEGREGMDSVKNDLAEKTGDVMDQAKEQTGQAMDQVRGSAFQMMDQQKHRAADGLGSVASALRQTGDNLQTGDQGTIGQYATRAADTVDQIAEQLREKNVEQLLSEAEQFARREPEIFLGGAVPAWPARLAFPQGERAADRRCGTGTTAMAHSTVVTPATRETPVAWDPVATTAARGAVRGSTIAARARAATVRRYRAGRELSPTGK